MVQELKSRSLLIILIICGVVLFALGAAAGAVLQGQKTSGSSGARNIAATPQARSLASKVITSITFLGKVESVSEKSKTIKISNNGEIAQALVEDKAPFFIIDTSSGKPIQKPAKISDAQTGDTITMTIKVNEDNSFTATSAVIFPKPKAK